MTQVEVYMEALRQLEVAVEELDQAHATLRNADMERYSTSHVRGRRLDIKEIYQHAESLLEDLKKAECDECCKPVLEHPLADCKEWKN